MKTLKRIFTALLILLALNLYLPNITFAEQALTKHPPKILSTPEEDMPKPKIKEKKTSSWTYLIGIVLIAGIAAAAGGGGGGDGDGNNTGSVTVGW